jgi:hypothetical protein
MHFTVHLFRWGAIWYWRRKWWGFSTGLVDLHLSLPTTCKKTNRNDRAKVDGRERSDREVVNIGQTALDVALAVIERASKRVTLQPTLQRLNNHVGTINDDARHDTARKTAWAPLATV